MLLQQSLMQIRSSDPHIQSRLSVETSFWSLAVTASRVNCVCEEGGTCVMTAKSESVRCIGGLKS